MTEPPSADVIARLSLIGDAVDRHVVERLTEAGFPHVGVGHGYVIQRLLTGPQQVTAMAGDLGVTQQAISKTVKELVRLGLASQSVDDTDSRRRPVVLTDRGRTMVQHSRAIRANLMTRLAATVTPRDLAGTERALDALAMELGLTEQIRERLVPPPPE